MELPLPVERTLVTANREPVDIRPLDRRIAEVAARQHGVITFAQLLAIGVSSSAVSRRVSSGRLHRVHRAVYAVGHAGLSREGRWLAAVLAAGPGAVLAGRGAAELWRISRLEAERPSVLTPVRHAGLVGVDVRHSTHLPDADRTVRDAVPVLRVHRLLLDLARDLTQWQLANVIHEAAFRRVLDREFVDSLLGQMHHARGMAVLRQALAIHDGGSAGSKSTLEDEFIRIILAARLPMAEVNTVVATPGGRYRVDFVWRRRRLCIETDGRASHERPATVLEDQVRDDHLAAAGFRAVRFTGRRVWNDPFGVARDLERLPT